MGFGWGEEYLVYVPRSVFPGHGLLFDILDDLG